MKVLALDFGAVRTGVAVSDATGTIARPLGVVERAATPDGLSRLAEIVREEDAERIVVGLPLTLRGERGEQAEATEDFVLERRGPVVIGSACSGHGFKFTPLVGRILADHAMSTG